MSKSIDEKVVQMQFDNRQFESNVRTSMNTLDKLKQSLKLDDAAKGLDNIKNATKGFDISPMSNGVETVRMKFSALEVMAVTALSNITNSAVNAGKKLVAAFTIDPVKTGFQEYELKMGSIQTIMASTGESLATVNKYLEELNTYSDKTIYSFSDMTTNIGKFTNAGVKLDDAVKAIKGISNEAAVSGANANEASRAMYNFAQALSAGYVKLIDWKSIENANMATVEFKNELIKTAVACGTLTDNLDGTYTTLEKGTIINATKNFNDSLQEQWMTTEVLVNTLGKYADETTDIGKKAYAAAQDVKTFSMMMDTLKEAAQSGWAQTWELLVGDFEEAKSLFTELSERFGDIIAKSAESRNTLLKGGLESNWDKLITKINEAGIATDTFEEKLKATFKEHGINIDSMIEKEGSLLNAMKKMKALSVTVIKETLGKLISGEKELANTTGTVTGKLEDFQKIVNKVIRGEFGSGKERIEALNKAGQNAVVIQKLVNKVWERNGKTWKDTTITAEDLSEVISNLSEEEKKNLGITDEQVKSLQELMNQAGETGVSIDELIESFNKPSGRELLIDSLRKSLNTLQNIFGAVKKAWDNVFSPITSEQLYNIIESVHSFTENMAKSSESTERLQNALEGLFTVLKFIKDVVVKITSTGIKLGWKILKPIASFVLDVASAIGKLITATTGIKNKVFKPFSDTFEGITKVIESFADFLGRILGSLGDFINEVVDTWTDKLGDSKGFQKASGYITTAVDAISTAFSNLKTHLDKIDFSTVTNKLNAVGDFFVGLFNSFKNSEFGKSIINVVSDSFEKVIDYVKTFKFPKLDFKNFTTNMAKLFDFMQANNLSGVGGFFKSLFGFFKQQKSYKLEDLKNSILVKFSDFYLKYGDKIKKGFEKFGEILKGIAEFILGKDNISLPGILDLTKKLLAILVLFKVLKIVGSVTGVFESISDSIENFSKRLKWKAVGEAFKSLAIALGAFTICMTVIASMEPEKAKRSALLLLGVIGVMSGMVLALSFLASKIDSGLNMAGVAALILGMSISLGILVFTLKKLDGMEFKQLGKSFSIMAGILIAMAVSIGIVGRFCGGGTFKSVAAILTMLTALKMVLSILEDYAEYDWNSVKQAIPKMLGMLLSLALVLRVATSGIKAGANTSGLALLMISIVLSLKVLMDIMKDLANMDPDKMWQGILGITAILGGITVMLGVINATNKGGILQRGEKSINNFKGLAIALLGVCASIWILGKMDTGTLLKGGSAVIIILGMFSLIMRTMSQATGFKTSALIVMIIGFGLLMAEMATIIKILSATNWQNSVGAASALGLLLITMAGVMRALTKHQNKAKNIYKWIGALAVLGLVVGELAAILWLIKDVDPLNAIGQVVALDMLLMGMATCLTTLTKHTNKAKNIYKWIGALATLGLVVAELGAILGLMDRLGVNGGNALLQATAISELLLAMSGCLVMCDKIGNIGKNTFIAIGALAVLSLVVGEIGAILTLLDHFGFDGGKAIPQVIALSTMILAMSGCLVICDKIGNIGKNTFAAIGALALLSLVVGEIGAVLILLDHFGFDGGKALPQVIALSVMLLAMSGILAICAWIGPMAEFAYAGMLALAVFIGGLAIVVTALGEIAKHFEGFGPALDKGIEIMGKLGQAIGEFIGGILGGILSGITSVLPDIGSDLSNFMTNAQPFFDGLDRISLEMVGKAGALMAIIALLTGEGILNTLANIFTVGGTGKNLPNLGLDLGNFITNAQPFFDALVDFPVEAVNGMKTLAETISILSSSGITEAFSKIFNLGKGSLEVFGEQLVPFAEDIATFSQKVTGDGAIDSEAVTAACNAANEILTMAANLPKRERWYNSVTDLGTFGTDLNIFADAITGFSQKVSAEGAINLEAVNTACEASSVIISMAATLPKRERWYNSITDLGTFGKDLNIFGTAITGFSQKVSAEGAINLEAVTTACQASSEIITMAATLPKRERWFNSITDLGTFGKDLTKFATGITGFSQKVSAEGAINSEAITTACKSSSELINMAADLPKRERWFNNVQGLGTFGESLEKYGKKFSTFCGSISEITNIYLVSEVITQTQKLVDMIKGFSDADFSKSGDFEDALDDLGSGLEDFAGSIEDIDGTLLAKVSDSTSILAGTLSGLSGMDFSGGKTFNTALSTLGNGMNSFFVSIESINSTKLASVTSSVRSLVSLLNDISGSNFTGVSGFVSAINTLGTTSVDKVIVAFQNASPRMAQAAVIMFTAFTNSARVQMSNASIALSGMVQTLCQNISGKSSAFGNTGRLLMTGFASGIKSGASAVTTAINAVINSAVITGNAKKTTFVNVGSSLTKGFASGIQSGVSIVRSAINTVINETITVAKAKHATFVSVGSHVVQGFAKGIQSGTSTAILAMNIVVQSAVNASSLYYSSFFSAGASVVEGFASGISANTYQAEAAASAMAEAVYNAAKEKLKINSPSKIFRKMAGSVPEGFAQGIDRLRGLVERSSVNMAELAIDSTSAALSQINDVINSDEVIRPTISPVMDMSNMRSTNLQLGSNIDVSFAKPVSSLSQVIADAQDNINLSNNEVIKAINNLRSDLSDYYNRDDQEVALYVDSKKLATSLAKPMNRQLNILSKRGVY